MENFEHRWLQVEALMQERFGKKPDLEGMLYLIGINELGAFPDRKNFTKEQKQDLMHIAVCKLLSRAGIFVLDKYDEEGWPHYMPTGVEAPSEMKDQEQLLKECIILYFDL